MYTFHGLLFSSAILIPFCENPARIRITAVYVVWTLPITVSAGFCVENGENSLDRKSCICGDWQYHRFCGRTRPPADNGVIVGVVHNAEKYLVTVLVSISAGNATVVRTVKVDIRSIAALDVRRNIMSRFSTYNTAVVCHAKRKKLTSKIQKNPPEKKLPGGFKTYLNGFIMPF